MNYIVYIIRFLFRIKWWLILLPITVALMVYVKMGTMARMYKTQTTIYTGVVSGYDIETNANSRQDWNVINNAIDNLINIIKSQTTLRNVSMRLFAQHLMHGNPNKDNIYITAANYRRLLENTPKEVLALVDRTSDSVTLARLFAYEKADHDNYVYGLFHWTHRHYSYDVLNTIEVKRLSNSDMLEVSYQNDDPGIVYNTLVLLNDEFRNQYHDLRFGETSNVIAYFEGELERMRDTLNFLESDLKDYNIEHRVINYDEQTKHIAALSRDFELTYEQILLNYNGAESLRASIEAQIGGLSNFKDNAAFIEKLTNIAKLQSGLASAEVLSSNSDEFAQHNIDVADVRHQLLEETRSLRQLTADISSSQYTKEGISTNSMVTQWLNAVLLSTKSQAELGVMKMRRVELDDKYTEFSPIGSVLKQRQRVIGFSEQSYLSILQALNTARLRQKNLQMSSATLKIINPPVLPIGAEPSKRKLMVFASLFGTFFFVLSFFSLLELLDRTPHDKMRAERIIGGRVLGAFPGQMRLGRRRYSKMYNLKAAQYLCNATLNYLMPGEQNVVNFLSTSADVGKSQLLEQLAEQMQQMGLSVRTVSWNSDFDAEQKGFLMARSLADFVPEQKENATPLSQADVVLVEYPSFSEHSVPRELLQNAALNLLIVRADRTWKETDKLLYTKVMQQVGKVPLELYMMHTERNVVENFTGMLPPYGRLRKLLFQFGQFGFTSSLK
ncbi:MAG: exopolysaccharide biosynthesis protein [Alistipes sp.]